MTTRRKLLTDLRNIACIAAFVAPLAGAVAAPSPAPTLGPLPERVTFPSADGQAMLVGYVFKPQGPHSSRMPAVVMMHGRAGAYSSLAGGRYDASTLSKRHQQWGRLWAQQGYLAILVDGFGPRGYPQGFGRFTHDQRPETLNEVTVRPLDAYGALAYLRTRRDVIANRIALQGWSNGASATLATMASTPPAGRPGLLDTGFYAALAFYPGCGLMGQFKDGVLPYAPVQVFMGTADEEVSPTTCTKLVEKSRVRNADIGITLYPDATHDFDDPGRQRQSVAANAAARQDAMQRAGEFLKHAISQ